MKKLLELFETHTCLFCGAPLGDPPARQVFLSPRRAESAADEWLCPACQADLPFLAGPPERIGRLLLFSVFDYEGPVRRQLLAYKFQGKTFLAEFFADFAVLRLSMAGLEPAGIVPLPLGPGRLKKRGYNQAELFAKALGARLEVPVLPLLERARETPPQTHQASERLRKENLRGAFRLKQGAPVSGPLLLVDDVCTTGASLESAAAELAKAGVPFTALVIARDHLLEEEGPSPL